MKPLVSIVIPTYNRARDLERALRSILAQTYSNWETLIVDSDSPDDTDDVVKSFKDSRMRLLKIHTIGAIAASRNLGIKRAQGEYIAFLDSDDWWTPDKLSESVRYLEDGADVVYHHLFLVTKNNQRFFWRTVRTRNLKAPVLRDLMVGGNTVANSSVVVRKCLLDQLGGLSEDRALVAAEDFDAWLKIARLTDRFIMVPRTLGYYWSAGGNVTNPERTLRLLEELEKRYANELNEVRRGCDTWWFDYSKARSYYELGCYQEAKEALRRLCWYRVPRFVLVRMCWMLLMMSFRSSPGLDTNPAG